MSKVIIGIHGLGNKPHSRLLKRWWKRAMVEGLKTQGYSNKMPKFELVYWTDVIHDKPQRISEQDEKSPQFLRERYVKAPDNFISNNSGTRKKIVDFVNKQMSRILLNKDLTLNYSFLSDAIVKNFFTDLEIYYKVDCTEENKHLCKVKDIIKERLIKKLEKYKDDQIMLISHSMGSIIAFDVLSSKGFNIPIHTFVTAGSPLGFPVVMSKIAAEQKQKVSTETTMLTPPTISKNWYNFSDILDRVALNYKLSESFSENKNGVLPVDYLVVNNFEINGNRNPHKSYGYLRTPEFSKILNNFIQTDKFTFKQNINSKIIQVINAINYKFRTKNT